MLDTSKENQGLRVSKVDSANRLQIVDAMRGLAAVAVALYHFAGGNGAFHTPAWITSFTQFGNMGVPVFFAISGFIIPFSLYRGGFSAKDDFLRFLVKRVIRIDPPYLASMLVCAAVAWLATFYPGYSGKPVQLSAGQLLLHVGYLAGVFGQPWLQDVYWTLAIEFQYYLLVAVFFPLLTSGMVFVRLATLGSFLAVSQLLTDSNFVFCWLPLFVVGIVTFQHNQNIASNSEYVLILVTSLCVGFNYLLPQVCVAILAAIAMRFVRVEVPRIFLFLGAISYSLYLLHLPVGMKIINLGTRLPDSQLLQVLTLFLAIVMSVLAAWMMYVLVELPSIALASKFKYREASVRRSDVVVDQSGFGGV